MGEYRIRKISEEPEYPSVGDIGKINWKMVMYCSILWYAKFPSITMAVMYYGEYHHRGRENGIEYHYGSNVPRRPVRQIIIAVHEYGQQNDRFGYTKNGR
eukprot:599152-Rhodomonas_salina.1